jgi:amino acid permease
MPFRRWLGPRGNLYVIAMTTLVVFSFTAVLALSHPTNEEAGQRVAMLIDRGLTALLILILILRYEYQQQSQTNELKQVVVENTNDVKKHADVVAEKATAAAEKIDKIERQTNGELEERLNRIATKLCDEREKQFERRVPELVKAAVVEAFRERGCGDCPRIQT